jgi:hypothetical protein
MANLGLAQSSLTGPTSGPIGPVGPAGPGGTPPGGVTGQVQINLVGSFAGQDLGGGYMSIGSDVTDGILLIDDSENNGIEMGASVGGIRIESFGTGNSTKVMGGGAFINLGFLGDSTFSLQSGDEIVIQTEDGDNLTIDAGSVVFGSATAVTMQDTLEITAKVMDVHGSAGTSGQVLSSTGTTVQWVTPVVSGGDGTFNIDDGLDGAPGNFDFDDGSF